MAHSFLSQTRDRVLGSRLWRRESLWVIAAGIAFALVMNWPFVTNMSSAVSHDILDPLVFSWKLAWPGYALTHGENLWDANIFHPARDSFAYTDSLLGYLPFSFFGEGNAAAITRHNLVFLFSCAIAFIGMYALVRQLGGVWQAAGLGAVVWASAPWRLAHDNHLNILATGGIALTFFALARGHGYSFLDGYRPDRVRVGWIVTGWLLACWQITIGFAIGLPFAYALVVVVVLSFYGWLAAGRPRLSVVALCANLGGFLTFVVVAYLMSLPYMRISERDNATRTVAEVDLFSPPARGFIAAPESSWAWGNITESLRQGMAWAPEMTILMGFTVMILGVAGLFYSAWRISTRIVLGVGMFATAVAALGTNFLGGGKYTYLLLWEYLPGWNALRTPGRLIIWTTICAVLLAAGLLTRLAAQVGEVVRKTSPAPRRGHRFVMAMLLVPAVVALLEGRPAYVFAIPPKIPPTLQQEFTHATSPILVLPAAWRDTLPNGWLNFANTYWSTQDFPRIVNGAASFAPPVYRKIAEAAESFPDESSIATLKRYGIYVVVVLPSYLSGTAYEGMLLRPITDLPITRTDKSDAVVYRIKP